MQQPLIVRRGRSARGGRVALLAAVALAAAIGLAAALSGCGGGSSRPDPTPVKIAPSGYKPTPPRFPVNRAPGAIYVVDLTDAATVRPATLAFASNGTLQGLQWTSWGGSTAEGHGTAALRVCTPSCVAGHNVSYPVTVSLSSPASCFGAHFYGDSLVVADTPKGRQREASFLRNPCANPLH